MRANMNMYSLTHIVGISSQIPTYLTLLSFREKTSCWIEELFFFLANFLLRQICICVEGVQNKEPPQNVQLWHVDYFALKAVKIQQRAITRDSFLSE